MGEAPERHPYGDTEERDREGAARGGCHRAEYGQGDGKPHGPAAAQPERAAGGAEQLVGEDGGLGVVVLAAGLGGEEADEGGEDEGGRVDDPVAYGTAAAHVSAFGAARFGRFDRFGQSEGSSQGYSARVMSTKLCGWAGVAGPMGTGPLPKSPRSILPDPAAIRRSDAMARRPGRRFRV